MARLADQFRSRGYPYSQAEMLDVAKQADTLMEKLGGKEHDQAVAGLATLVFSHRGGAVIDPVIETLAWHASGGDSAALKALGTIKEEREKRQNDFMLTL
jgi:hypothetical protein